MPLPVKPVTPSATELKAMKEKGIVGEIIEYTQSPPIIIKPLELQYKWTGVHIPCNSEPRTIAVDLGDSKVGVIAYCMNCDMKLDQMDVPAIPKRLTIEEVEAKSKKK